MPPTRALKSKRLNFRISDAQDELLRRVATARQQSVTDFILESACSVARFELTEPTEFKLPPADWQAFLIALDNPSPPTGALRRLMAEPSVLEQAQG